MTDNQTPPSDEQLPQVGWWCWRGDNHGHLAMEPCRSDNVPIHVPVEWVGEMRAVIQQIEEGDDEDDPAASAVVAVAVPPTGQTALRDRIAEALYANDHPGHLVPLNETGMGPAYRESADAVLAVLPPPADRAAVLREAADVLAKSGNAHHRNTANRLRRLADEAQQQPETRTVQTVEHAPGTAILCPDCCAKGHAVCMADQPATAAEEAPPVVPCPPGCIACATDESHDPAQTKEA